MVKGKGCIFATELQFTIIDSYQLNTYHFNKNYNKMEKKIYVAPAMRAVQMRHKARMLETSEEPTRQSKRNQYESVEW